VRFKQLKQKNAMLAPCPLYPPKAGLSSVRICASQTNFRDRRRDDLHHSLVVETGRLGFESSQRNGLGLTSNTETPCPFVSIGEMLQPITEKRVYDCREPLPLEKSSAAGRVS
jgi:hypothetical protein